MLEVTQASKGIMVQSNVEFSGVPKGTVGIIDEDYESGVMVAWDLPGWPLTDEYIEHVRRYGCPPKPRDPLLSVFRPLRDGFGKNDELKFLDMIDQAAYDRPPRNCPYCNGEREWDGFSEIRGKAICHFCSRQTLEPLPRSKRSNHECKAE